MAGDMEQFVQSAETQPAQALVGRDRRLARRVEPHEVSWIRSVKPAAASSARLVNISRTGVLLETTARLQPGCRTIVLIVGDLDEEERAEARVLRTELVAISPNGELIYRSALAFSGELDLRLMGGGNPSTNVALSTEEADADTVMSPAGELLQRLRLDGPLAGFWATERGSQRIAVSQLTQTGCIVPGIEGAFVDLSGSVTVIFSAVRALTLSARVVGVDQSRSILEFLSVSGDVQRALQQEILAGITFPATGGTRL